jgi:hypothetical protein
MLGPFTAVSISPADQEWLQLILMIMVLFLFVIKQVTKYTDTPRMKILDALITIPVVPLTIAFLAVIAYRSAVLFRL